MVRKTPEPSRQTNRGAVNSADPSLEGGAECHLPDGAVVASSDSDGLFGVEVERPQLALAVPLH